MNTPTNPTVEMWVDGEWVDITADCRLSSADSGGGINIKRGRSNEAPRVEPTELDFILNNGPSKVEATEGESGCYTILNPNGPYYGKLGRNQPVRVGLSRVTDDFTRTLSNSWGSTPDWVDPLGETQSGYEWNLTGVAGNFDVTGTAATIQGATGFQCATFGVYGDVDILTKVKASNRTTEFGIVARFEDDAHYYTAYVAPLATDRMRIGRVVPGSTIAFGADLVPNFTADVWYWMRAQVSGQRFRVKMWADGTDEPVDYQRTFYDNYVPAENPIALSGEVGLFASGGSALITFDSIQVDQWRAHTEIVTPPPRYDLSRNDRWVPMQARGVLRRLGQGRKALNSAVYLHLQSYSATGVWLPLESALSATTATNAASGGLPGASLLVSYQSPDLSGEHALPGVAGYAHLDDPTSYVTAYAAVPQPSHTQWTVLSFFRLDANPVGSEILLFNYQTTGTARNFRAYLQTDGGFRIECRSATNALLDSGLALLWGFTDNPIGHWVACTLYVYQSGGNVIWAMNYHQPGSGSAFFTINGSFAGTVGQFRNFRAGSSATHDDAGGLSLAHVFHYMGDLPFVTNAFALAASAYDGETAGTRFGRLCDQANIPWSTHIPPGLSSVPMGPQLPSKLLELLDECADAEHGFIAEARDSNELEFHALSSLYNLREVELDIDAGHLSPPLDPTPDDQGTRNRITVKMPNGGAAVSIQTEGPLNVNPPETDPDGVGEYPEEPEINLGDPESLQSAADWRRSLGTVPDPRYPSITADLTASAYQIDPAITAQVMSVDSGRMLRITNPEVAPDPFSQLVQSYNETIDQFDWQMQFVATPGRVYREIGVVGETTRVSPHKSVTASSFVSGTGTALSVQRDDPPDGLWVRTADDAGVTGFDIMVGGVQLTVVSISGTTDPQTITVVQTPVNGVIKTIPAGSPVTLAVPWRVGW